MTIEDISKQFHVSISTVSKALNGSTDIAEKTRKAICEYANSVGYRSRRSKAIKGRLAVLLGAASDDARSLPEIASAFCREAEAENYLLTQRTIDSGFILNSFLAERQYTGVFALGVDVNSAAERELKASGYPVVFLGTPIADAPQISGVKSDHLVAVSKAVDHLVSLGHSLIAFIGSEDLTGAERFAGYFFGLSKNAIPYRYDLTRFDGLTEQAGRNAADYFLSYDKYFTAAVCASRASALGFIDVVRRAGKRVPEDISVICFGDSPEEPSMTAIAQDFDELGKRAFEVLKATLQGFPAQHCAVPCSLVNTGATCTV
ncbi:MAG: LacI family transcriptional regulator, partial [Clostridia bacterium]|nr:LacI family transcriptional regulator [Clostridia bacterium]